MRTYDNAVPRAFEDDARNNMPSAIYAAALMDAKNDNWPSIFSRMQDPRNLCMVTLHQPLDFRISMWAGNTSELTTHAGSTIRLAGELGYYQGATPATFTAPGQESVTLKTGLQHPFMVVDSDPSAVWLQTVEQEFDQPFKMPYDLLVASVANAAIGRLPCKEDKTRWLGNTGYGALRIGATLKTHILCDAKRCIGGANALAEGNPDSAISETSAAASNSNVADGNAPTYPGVCFKSATSFAR